MSWKINRPESNSDGNVMVLGKEYPLFTHVPPLKRDNYGHLEASELRVLYIDGLEKAMPIMFSVRDQVEILATSIAPYGVGYRFNGSDVDPMKRAEKIMRLPASWLHKQSFETSGMSLGLMTNEFDFVDIGLSRLANERLSITGDEITRPKMPELVKEVLRGLRILIIFPGEEPDEEEKGKGRVSQQYEGQPESFSLEDGSYLSFGDFYPPEIGPLVWNDKAINLVEELFEERFGSNPERGLNVDDLVSRSKGLGIILPYGERLTQARMRFHLLS